MFRVGTIMMLSRILMRKYSNNRLKLKISLLKSLMGSTVITISIIIVFFIGIWAFSYRINDSIGNPESNQPTSAYCCHPADECWKTIDVNTLSPQQIVDYFMWTNRSACEIAQDFGGRMLNPPTAMIDGSKAICLDPAARPNSNNCIVYSFGINHDWSFDELMETYGCHVYAFDPSMGVEDHDHSKRIKFFNLGLDDRDYVDLNNKWSMKNFASIYQSLHTQQSSPIIDYLKLDIEFAEWRVIPDIIRSGMIKRIRQLHIEIHLTKDDSLELLRQRVGIIKMIEDAGMIRFDSRGNPYYRAIIESLDLTAVFSLGYDLAWYQILPQS